MNRQVTVDFSAVELMLPILPYVDRQEEPPEQLIDELVSSPGIRMWLRHAGRHGNMSEEYYRRIIRAAAGLDQQVSGHYVNYLRKNASRSAEFRRIMQEFRRIDISELCNRAYAAVNEHLRHPFHHPVNFYLMCATRGSAIVLDYDIAMDIADFADPADSPLPLALIAGALAHEVFHMGRRDQTKPWPRESWTGTQGWAADLLGMLMEEGAATYLFSMENFRLPDWQEADSRLAEIQQKVTGLFASAFTGSQSEGELRTEIYGMFGSEGYVLGARICQAIDEALGRDALYRALEMPSDFLVLFNQAARSGHSDIPPFREEDIRKIQGLGI